ncbi:MAG: WD40 repeat domain-containing protein [Planctomycetota bacterium]
MSRKSKIRCGGLIFRTSAGFMFIAFSIALPAMSVDFSQEPSRLGSGWVSSIAFSPDGTILAAWYDADGDWQTVEGELRLWDVETQEQVGELKGLGPIYAIAFSPDGTLLALGGEGNTIRLWDVAGQNQVGLMQSPTIWGVLSVAFSPDGKTLASSGSGDNTVRLWDVQAQKQIGVLQGHRGNSVSSVAFSPDGRLLASGGWRGDTAVRLWDVQTQQQVGELIGHLDITYALAFSPDGIILASAGGWEDKAVYLWDVQAQNQVGVLGGHSAHVVSVAFSPNGKLLASAVTGDDTVHLWDIAGQEQVGVLKGHDALNKPQVAFSSDGKWLAAGSENGVELWELNLPGPISRAYAFGPQPFDGTLHTDTWVTLDWRPGDFAVSHDVYLGDNFEDVNAGTGDTFRGNQLSTNYIIGFTGFAYPDGLVRGTTYYWRVDEVNDAEPNSPWKGDVWSFSIPPKTAYNPAPSDGAEFVDLNVELNWTAGLGAGLHTVYFGDNLDDVSNAAGGLQQGSTTNTPGLLEFAKTYYWRVDEFGVGRGGETHKGDIWSFTTEGAVGSPEPANGAVDVTQAPVLTWSPGVYGASHEVYFGTDKEAVKNADTGSPEYKGSGNLGSESYEAGNLEWNTTYYWRIDEANNANADSPWKGPVWSFTTANFLVMDDFEDYDIGNNEIWWAWKDGAGYTSHPTEPSYPGNGTGSMVGDESTGSYTEEIRVHGGSQAMPVFYDNSVLKYSEVEKTLTYPRDWTENGVNTLSIWFRGDSANAAETMYVALNNSAVVYHDNPDAAQIISWTRWNIDLQAFADQGVNLSNVNTITLGLGNRSNPVAGGAGKVFFDDIRLYRPRNTPEE